MGITLPRIEAYLDAWNWNYRVDRANSRMIITVRSPVINPLEIMIELKQQGSF